jgi:uncharacterized protein YbjT (DUF2867 family)
MDEDRALDQLEYERSQDNRAYSRIKEERRRRMDEDRALDQLEYERSQDNRAYSRIKEEEERQRRMANDAYLDDLEDERRRDNRAYSRIKEEEEKARRVALEDYNRWKEEYQRKTDLAWVNVKEEEERQRRMALAGYPPSMDRDQSELNRAWTTVKEEEERSRRMAADAYLDDLEMERRRNAKAETIIKEEEERQRRIAEDAYLDELAKERSEENRAYSRIAEEEERQRRMSETAYRSSIGQPIHAKYGNMPREAADLARSKYGSPSVRREMPQRAPVSPPNAFGVTRTPVPKKIPIHVPPPTPTTNILPSQPRGVPVTSAAQPGMQMGSKPIIAVFGGTGAQGKGVVKSLLNSGRFAVRILTRDPNKKKSCNKFANMGVSIVTGDMHKPDDVRRFLNGVYGVYLMTDFFNPESKGKEDLICRQVAQLAKEAGVRHFVWSTLPNVGKISGGRYDVPHFTDKANGNKFVKQMGFPCWTFVLPAFYYQNFATFFAPKRENDVLTWTLPMAEDKYLTAVDVRDIGPTVAQIFNNPQMYNMKKIPIAGDHLHPQDYIIKLGLISKRPVKIVLITPEQFAKQNREMAAMFAYFQDHGFYGPKGDWTLGRQVYPRMNTWEQYLRLELQKANSPSQSQ